MVKPPVPPTARCLSCNYPLLHTIDNRCPECGRAFDPFHPGTMNTIGRPVGAIERWALRPVLWPLHLAVAAASLWTMFLFRWPNRGLHFSIWNTAAVQWTWIAISLVWAALLVTMLALINRRRIPAAFYRQRWSRWAVIPIMVLLTWFLIAHEAPFRLMVLISRPAMNRYADQVIADAPHFSYPERWIGPYWAKRPFFDGELVGFSITDDSVFSCRLVRVPERMRPLVSDWGWNDLGGGWYRTHEGMPDRLYREAPVRLLEKLARDPEMARRSLSLLIGSLQDNQLENQYYRYTSLVEDPIDQAALHRNLRPDMKALLSLRDDAIPELRQAILSGDPEVSFRAAVLLRRLATKPTEQTRTAK